MLLKNKHTLSLSLSLSLRLTGHLLLGILPGFSHPRVDFLGVDGTTVRTAMMRWTHSGAGPVHHSSRAMSRRQLRGKGERVEAES